MRRGRSGADIDMRLDPRGRFRVERAQREARELGWIGTGHGRAYCHGPGAALLGFAFVGVACGFQKCRVDLRAIENNLAVGALRTAGPFTTKSREPSTYTTM